MFGSLTGVVSVTSGGVTTTTYVSASRVTAGDAVATFQMVMAQPWPVPNRPWSWQQAWCDLLFIHFEVEPAAIAALLPPGQRLRNSWIHDPSTSTQTRLQDAIADFGPAIADLFPEGAIFNDGQSMALFEDAKARNIGDLVTILLIENTQAQKSAQTTTSKASDVNLTDITVLGRPIGVHTGITGARSSKGSGDSKQSNSLDGSVTAVVVGRLPNGLLQIRGEKQVELNQGSETLFIDGVVRPVDILANNTVSSDRVGNARVSYKGRGALADARELRGDEVAHARERAGPVGAAGRQDRRGPAADRHLHRVARREVVHAEHDGRRRAAARRRAPASRP